ncbi:MAG: hypothetical protein C0467_31890 [Planctomycetaceae bacterium]|nr:hypothetical protein [Planctomycetaceae bacterium]
MAEEKCKASRLEVAERVEEILKIRLDGAQFHDCVTFAKEKGWNVSERQVGRYISSADELLVERLEKKRKPVIARHIAQRQALFARAVNAADLRTALAILDSECKLRGLFPEAGVKDLLKLLASQEERLRKMEGNSDAVTAGPATPQAQEPSPPAGQD